MRGGVGELEGAGHVARGVDVGVDRLQEVVGLHRLGGGDAEFFEPEAGQVGGAADGHEHGVEGDVHILATMLGDEHLLAIFDHELLGAGADAHVDAFGDEAGHHGFRHVFILARHDARQHLDLGDLAAETGEGLGQLAADRAAAEHQQATRLLA